MRTSKTIKAGQKAPPRILRRGQGSWLVQGKTCRTCWAENEAVCQCGSYVPREYWVTRGQDRRIFYCACPADRLCRHVTAVVLDCAKGTYGVVQVWTDEVDAKRQRRRTVQFYAHSKPFWVTYARQRPLVGVVRFCRSWDGQAIDLFHREADGSDRHERREDLSWEELVNGARSLGGWVERGAYLVRRHDG